MAEFALLKRSFGTIFTIAYQFRKADHSKLDLHIETLKSSTGFVYIDLNKMVIESRESLSYIVLKTKELSNFGVDVTLIKAKPEIKAAFDLDSVDPQRPVRSMENMDEALFPAKSPYRPKIQTSHPKKKILCPSCNIPIRLGAIKCLHCGKRMTPRRAERRSISVPFLYTVVRNKEFIQTTWMGGMTEDMDLHTFAGVGFFSMSVIEAGTSLQFIFPTLRWSAGEDDLEKLLIFTGRVKHCANAEHWYRIGVALIDVIEYRGKFDVHTEMDEDE